MSAVDCAEAEAEAARPASRHKARIVRIIASFEFTRNAWVLVVRRLRNSKIVFLIAGLADTGSTHMSKIRSSRQQAA